MELGRQRRSTNVQDRRGGGLGGGVVRLGLPAVLLAGLIGFFFPQARPFMDQIVGQAAIEQTAPDANAPDDEWLVFSQQVLGSTEDVWGQLFAKGALTHYGAAGQAYQQPTLVLFSGAVSTHCGAATSAVGPFYCPGDQQLYLDVSFFRDMERQLGAGGDFAHAYVIAHEVGHHVQALLGLTTMVERARRTLPKAEANAMLVRLELQADCFAGVWGHYAGERGQLSTGDIAEAVNAASAIGDDRLSGGRATPDSFTHGTSAQRVEWLERGLKSGDPAQCDTFGGFGSGVP